jgi:hypothetical protein
VYILCGADNPKTWIIMRNFRFDTAFLAILPKIKTEYARGSFHFMGAKVYNELPLEIRQAGNYKDFANKLSS